MKEIIQIIFYLSCFILIIFMIIEKYYSIKVNRKQIKVWERIIDRQLGGKTEIHLNANITTPKENTK